MGGGKQENLKAQRGLALLPEDVGLEASHHGLLLFEQDASSLQEGQMLYGLQLAALHLAAKVTMSWQKWDAALRRFGA